jgi:predicted acyltransferase
MLFIMGLSEWIVAVCGLFPACGATEWLTLQMRHVQWHGLTHHDTIFPLFLFLAGLSFPFSIAKQRAGGKSQKDIYLKILRRGLTLVLLGVVYNGFFRLDFPDLRYASVLGRIGLAWMFAALLFMRFRLRTCVALSAVVLVGYWLMMWLIPSTSDPYSFEGNLAGMVDRMLLPGRMNDGTFDPEGILSTLPAIVTALLGMFTGRWVQMPDERFSGNQKAVYMLAGAVLLFLAGWAGSCGFPLNKKLWTSTFVCVVGAYSLLLFAVFYWIIDVKGHYRRSFVFRVVGLNSITIYLAQRIIPFRQVSDFFLGGLAGKCPEVIATLIQATGYMTVCWLFLYFLYTKKVFLKV